MTFLDVKGTGSRPKHDNDDLRPEEDFLSMLHMGIPEVGMTPVSDLDTAVRWLRDRVEDACADPERRKVEYALPPEVCDALFADRPGEASFSGMIETEFGVLLVQDVDFHPQDPRCVVRIEFPA